MKRFLIISALVIFLVAANCYAQMGPGMMGGSKQNPEPPYPWSQGYGMGPGMMGGYGMGPGMMGWGMHPGMMGGYGMGPGMMGGYGMGPGMMGGYGMGPGMMYDYQPEMQKFLDDTVELRKKIHMKKFEYFEATRNPKTTREKIIGLQKELQELVLKLQGKAPKGFFYGR
jgi:hypothetical protein